MKTNFSSSEIRKMCRTKSLIEMKEDIESLCEQCEGFKEYLESHGLTLEKLDEKYYENSILCADGMISDKYKQALRLFIEFNDEDYQDFLKFRKCQDRLEALHSEVSNYWECGISDFGEALATDREVAEKEYKALQDAYKDLHDELYPIMKDAYKGYKSHCEWCRVPYTYYEEFEEADEDDIYHLLGLD